jgi:DNA polymerase III delta subunit
VKYYEFVDNIPPVPDLVFIEGVERVLADDALAALLDRVLPEAVRDMNLTRVASSEWTGAAPVREALSAMPFLAERRVVVVEDAQMLKAAARAELLALIDDIPAGNTLVIVDLLSPRSQRPLPLGAKAGRGALRIDTTANEEVRARFIGETLKSLGASAHPRVTNELARSQADLASVRNDLQKLALSGEPITYAQLEAESLAVEDPKAYRYASALVEGKTAQALSVAQEFFTSDPRSAALQLLSALATECGLLWEAARPGGELPERFRWRERVLRPIARRLGERWARMAYSRAVDGIEAVVTGAVGSDPEDARGLVERLTVELSTGGRR